MLYGTDVGGIFRSTNGGVLWEPANIDYNSRGVCDFAIDPVNPNHCLAVGSNQPKVSMNGIYYSANKGLSWYAAMDATHSSYHAPRHDRLRQQQLQHQRL